MQLGNLNYVPQRAATIVLPQLLLNNESTFMKLPQLTSLRLLLGHLNQHPLLLLLLNSFVSSLTHTGSSTMLDLVETIGTGVNILRKSENSSGAVFSDT